MQSRNRSSKRNTKGSKRLPARGSPLLELHPAFPGQAVDVQRIHVSPTKLVTTVTTGIIAHSQAVTVGNIPTFTTRFAAWREYRVIKAHAKVRCFSSTNPGVFRAWFDEKDGNVPTSTMAINSNSLEFSCSAGETSHELVWSPSDPLDLEYTQLGTNVFPAYFKVYTDNALFGSSVAATDYAVVTIQLTVQFRGFA